MVNFHQPRYKPQSDKVFFLFGCYISVGLPYVAAFFVFLISNRLYRQSRRVGRPYR